MSRTFRLQGRETRLTSLWIAALVCLMGLELSITSSSTPRLPKKRKRQPRTSSVVASEKARPTFKPAQAPSQAPVTPTAAARESIAPPPALERHAEAPKPPSDEAKRPPKRARYASAPGGAPRREVEKLDPSKAKPLPATFSLDAKSHQNAFSTGTFAELPLDKYLHAQIRKMELDRLTPVQQLAIPRILDGRDMLIRSPTGSGKTLAYALPAVQALVRMGAETVSRAAGTFVLVLLPTRELSLQTHEVMDKLCQPFPWIVCGMLMGGERRKAEKARLRKGVSIVVGTPGRVIDHMRSTQAWVFCGCPQLILDEADRLLDLGFQKDIEAILSMLNTRATPGTCRQTILLSATLTSKLRTLAGESLSEYETLQLTAKGVQPNTETGESETARRPEDATCISDNLEAPLHLQQSFVVLPSKQRLTGLVGFLRSRCHAASECKVLVFLCSCDSVDFLFSLLARTTWPDLHAAKVAAGHAAPSDGMRTLAEEGSAVTRSSTPALAGTGDEEADRCSADENMEAQGGLDSMSELIGTRVLRLHGKLSQKQRTAVFQRFRHLKSGVLFCTDVAARGLNLKDVHWIVQYDLPQDPKEYVHRVGRAARLGQRGRAVIFLNPSEEPFLKLLREFGMHLVELKFASLQAALSPTGSKRDIYVMELALQRQLEAAVLELPFLQAASRAAYQSYLRSYATQSKDIQKLLHIGQLHLGHLAKSFGLKEKPSQISREQQKQREHMPVRKARKRGLGQAWASAGRHGLSVGDRLAKSRGSTAVGVKTTISEFGAG
ncbi:hypothetical protein AB1Y20_017383 [Prymnesium parvum]|uniref:ATP-dependent RNA helicase n=1 Tax=Prymnesium parvum TaxID=97485 RepID=A0AB34JL45_PRYPA